MWVRAPKILKWIYPGVIWNIPNTENKIYLTFDDGPEPEVTPEVLAILNGAGIKATFFCIGKNVKSHPEIYHKIQEEGHAIGNHTMHHVNGWKTPAENYLEDVKNASAFITSKLFRPPYGRLRRSQLEGLKKEYRVILWDVITYDFDKSVSPEQCLSNAVNNTESGSVIVFHDSIKAKTNLLYTLPKFIDTMKEKGFVFDKI